MIGRRNFFGSAARGAVAAICGAIGLRSAGPAEATTDDHLSTGRPAETTQLIAETMHVEHWPEPVPPMTVERAVEIQNRHRYYGAAWRYSTSCASAFGAAAGCREMYSLEPFAAVAVAEKLERDRQAKFIHDVNQRAISF